MKRPLLCLIYRSVDVIGGAVAGAILFGIIVIVVIVIICKKQVVTRGRVTNITPATTVTTVHQPPPLGTT